MESLARILLVLSCDIQIYQLINIRNRVNDLKEYIDIHIKEYEETTKFKDYFYKKQCKHISDKIGIEPFKASSAEDHYISMCNYQQKQRMDDMKKITDKFTKN